MIDSCSQVLSDGQSLSSTSREWKLQVVTATEKNISHQILSAEHLPASFLADQNKELDPNNTRLLLCDLFPCMIRGDGWSLSVSEQIKCKERLLQFLSSTSPIGKKCCILSQVSLYYWLCIGLVIWIGP